MNKIENELEKLKILNEPKRVKLRYNKTKAGKYSLYLDYSKNGRTKEYLKISLNGDDKYFKDSKQKLSLALNIRDERELELLTSGSSFELKHSDIDFITYFEELGKERNETYNHSLNYLKEFHTGAFLPVSKIDRSFCSRFAKFLENLDIASSTANLYFKKFVAVLNEAVRNDIIRANPANSIKIKHTYAKREFLTKDELETLINTPMQVEDTKRAFIFACNTGLRLSDLANLKFENVKGGFLYIKQQKTQEELRIKLSADAQRIIDLQQSDSDYVFDLKPKNQVARIMKRWIKRSGIEKNITFHSSRHTFATTLLTNGADLYAVSKLIGHKDFSTTQIYAKLIDKKKDEAIDLLPSLMS